MSRMHSMPVFSGSHRTGPPGFGRASSVRNVSSPQSSQPMTPPPRSWSRSPPMPFMERRAVSMQSSGAIQAQIDHVATAEESRALFANTDKPQPTAGKEVADVLAALSIDDTIAEAEKQTEMDKNSTSLMTAPTTSHQTASVRVDSPPTPVAGDGSAERSAVDAQHQQQRSQPPTSSPATPMNLPASAGPTPFAALGSHPPPLSPGRQSNATSSLNHLATPFSAMASNDHLFGTPTTRAGSFSMQRALTEIPESTFVPQQVCLVFPSRMDVDGSLLCGRWIPCAPCLSMQMACRYQDKSLLVNTVRPPINEEVPFCTIHVL